MALKGLRAESFVLSDNSMEFLVMGSSWNFPARGSPSYESSEPSQAELGHFNFRAETELKFFYEL